MNRDRFDFFWKSYALTLGALLFWNYMNAVPFSLLLYADFAITMLGFSGFVMYAFHTKFLHPYVWRLWTFVAVGWDIYINFFSPLAAQNKAEVITSIIFLFLLLPEYLGLFLYGYFSRDLWESTEEK